MRYFLSIVIAVGAASAQEPKPTTTYYLMESVMTTPAGKPMGAPSASLVKRVTDAGKGTIEESVISLRGSDSAKEFITLIRPGTKTTVSGDGFEGTGELSGPEWAWSGMHFTVKMANPSMVIDGKDEFASDHMVVEKRVLGADGQPRAIIHEQGPAIPATVYEALRSRLMPK